MACRRERHDAGARREGREIRPEAHQRAGRHLAGEPHAARAVVLDIQKGPLAFADYLHQPALMRGLDTEHHRLEGLVPLALHLADAQPVGPPRRDWPAKESPDTPTAVCRGANPLGSFSETPT